MILLVLQSRVLKALRKGLAHGWVLAWIHSSGLFGILNFSLFTSLYIYRRPDVTHVGAAESDGAAQETALAPAPLFAMPAAFFGSAEQPPVLFSPMCDRLGHPPGKRYTLTILSVFLFYNSCVPDASRTAAYLP